MSITINGIEDVNRILTSIAPREGRNILRATINDIAKTVATRAAERAPQDSGDLQGAIKPKRERGRRDTISATVRVGPKAFYWRFLEYGQGPDNVEHAFFLQTLQEIRPEIDEVYMRAFADKLAKRLRALAKKAG